MSRPLPDAWLLSLSSPPPARPATLQALADALVKNSHLQELSLSGHAMSVASAAALAAALQENGALQALAVGTPATGNAALKVLCAGVAQSRSLCKLDVANRGATGAHGGRALGAACCPMSRLESLDASRNALGDDGVAAFAQAMAVLPDLAAMNERAAARAVERIESPVFERLRLSGVGLGDRGAEALARALQVRCALVGLWLADNEELGEVGLRRLVSTAPLLETLDVSGTRTGAGPTGEWLERAAASGALKELTIARSGLAGTPVARLADGLAAAGCVLATLDASGNEGIGDGGAGCIAAAMDREGCVLRSLDLSECGLGAAGAELLCRAGSGLHRLGLRGNSLGDEGAQAVAAALGEAVEMDLRELSVAACGVGATGCEALCGALAAGAAPQLETLEMGGNEAAQGGVEEGEEDPTRARWSAAVAALREARPKLDVHWKAGERGGGVE